MSQPCEIVVQGEGGEEQALAGFLEDWLGRLIPSLAPEATSFAARLGDDQEIRELNRRLRGKDRTTDVLSFPGRPGPEGAHLGDVLISLPVARNQAIEAGHSLQRELQELVLHGVLHCLGHDHETDDGEMAALELDLRERWIE